MHDIWFEKTPIDGSRDMMDDGSYRYDFDDKLSVLSVNTLYFNAKNDIEDDGQIPA